MSTPKNLIRLTTTVKLVIQKMPKQKRSEIQESVIPVKVSKLTIKSNLDSHDKINKTDNCLIQIESLRQLVLNQSQSIEEMRTQLSSLSKFETKQNQYFVVSPIDTNIREKINGSMVKRKSRQSRDQGRLNTSGSTNGPVTNEMEIGHNSSGSPMVLGSDREI